MNIEREMIKEITSPIQASPTVLSLFDCYVQYVTGRYSLVQYKDDNNDENQFNSIQFNSNQFNSIQFNSIGDG